MLVNATRFGGVAHWPIWPTDPSATLCCTALLNTVVRRTALSNTAVYCTALLNTAVCRSMPHRIIKYGSILYRIIKYGSMPHLSWYYTLHVIVRGMRIWPPNAAKCCKNAGKFFPDVAYSSVFSLKGSVTAFAAPRSATINIYLLIKSSKY